MIRRALGACALFLMLAAVLVGARAALPAPEVQSWSAADQWYREVGTDVALASALVHLALGVSAWLLLAATAQLVAAVARGPLTTAAATMLAPQALRTYVHGLATASFAAGLAVTAPSGDLLMGGGEPGTATLELIAPVASPPATAPPAVSPPAASPPAANGSAPSAPVSVTVGAGDSFWSIAEEALVATRPASAAPPTTAEVADYWLRVVAANSGILVVPADPDLLYRGQVVTLPAVSPDSPDSPPSLGL